MLSKSKVKYIQTLGQKKFREAEGLFIAEGPKLVAELLQVVPGHISAVFALEEWLNEHHSLLTHVEAHPVTEIELEKISQLTTPNQVLALVKQFDNETLLPAKNKITLALDDIRDPGNLGTIIRIADWFGIPQIVCSRHCADVYNSKVVQSTMGSIARVHIVYTDLEEWLIQNRDVTVYAAMLEGKPVHTIGAIKEGILVIGNEAQGIKEDIAGLVNEKITIPRKGSAESLNAAVATGILLSQLVDYSTN
ncbi:MAG: RNA methyltransferase [Bacteroidetes bacterium]|nr:RNA methyltransferase [Bacteroidota bacterium]